MERNALSEYVLVAKYAGWNAQASRRETWDEIIDRVEQMHHTHYAGCGVDEQIDRAMNALRSRRVLGSQRGLQFGGDPILRKNARLYNCTASYCDRPRFFQESLWLLLCGCGVGFSVQKHHVARLPKIARPQGEPLGFAVEDSIEGWADALGVLVSSYFVEDQPVPAAAGRAVVFDYDQIRPAGSSLSGVSGKAPGPEPLRKSIEQIRTLLDHRVDQADGQAAALRPIDAYDLLMFASEAVMSGGVRRSATICLFSPDDDEMASAKTGNWFETAPQRARSNNSALLIRDQTSREQFESLMVNVRQFGEPGFIWADSTEMMVNPCAEIGLYPVDIQTGETGWAFCNLSEINIKAIPDREGFIRAAQDAAILGTLQAGYTSFDYLGPVTERIVQHEALLGVSMTGMMDNPMLAFDPELQREMAEIVLATNEALAKRLGLRPAARATCIKPAGTSSCLLGTASGVHPHHSRRYFRRAQASLAEAPSRHFAQTNPRAVEPSAWENGEDKVSLIFCVEADEQALTKADVTAVQMLERVHLTQRNWVAYGVRKDACARPWLSHNVSNTITVGDDEWGTVADYIYDHRDAFTGVSLLPDGGDLDYPQAPFCEVPTVQQVVEEYGTGALFASGLIVDGLHAFDDLWDACAHVLGHRTHLPHPVPPEDDLVALDGYRKACERYLLQRDWIRRAHKFAKNYFAGDSVRMTRCLKRVHNAKLWEDIQRTRKSVDYTQMIEAGDHTKPMEALACVGGACQIL